MDLRSVKGRMEGKGLTGMCEHTYEGGDNSHSVYIRICICVLGCLDQRGGEVQAWCDE